jgi:hypothetical protein
LRGWAAQVHRGFRASVKPKGAAALAA